MSDERQTTSVENELEFIILSYCVRDRKSLEKIMDFGVKADWFLDPNLRNFFDAISSSFRKHGTLFTKKQWMERLVINPDIDTSQLWRYEEFYDSLLLEDYSEDDLPSKLEQFESSVLVFRNSQFLRKYGDEVQQYGPKDAHERLMKRLSGIEFSTDKRRQYLISDLEDDGCDAVFEDAINRSERPEDFTGYKTGYEDIDEVFNGFQRGTLNLIFGLSSGGKTTFARSIAINMKQKYGANVLVVSCEERRQQFFRKVACAELSLDLKRWMRGELDDSEKDRLRVWRDEQKTRGKNRKEAKTPWIKLLQIAAKEYSIEEIDNLIDKELDGEQIDIIIVDHIGLLKPIRQIGDKTNIELGDSSKYLRDMADRRQCIAILLAQAGRNAVRVHRNKREVELNMENVEGSNQPYQDSDVVFGIRRDKEVKNISLIQLLKQRDGDAEFTIPLYYEKEYCRFANVEDIQGGGMDLGGSSTMEDLRANVTSTGDIIVPLPTADGVIGYSSESEEMLDMSTKNTVSSSIKIQETANIKEPNFADINSGLDFMDELNAIFEGGK